MKAFVQWLLPLFLALPGFLSAQTPDRDTVLARLIESYGGAERLRGAEANPSRRNAMRLQLMWLYSPVDIERKTGWDAVPSSVDP